MATMIAEKTVPVMMASFVLSAKKKKNQDIPTWSKLMI